MNNWVTAICIWFLVQTAIGQQMRGLYVDGFDAILGNAEKENRLLAFSQQQQFNYLLLYDLYKIEREQPNFPNNNKADQLADFIKKARIHYGIKQIAATGESYAGFRSIIAYQKRFKTQKEACFDIFNLEFEYWNTCVVSAKEVALKNEHCFAGDHLGELCKSYLIPNGLECNRKGAFTFYKEQLKLLSAYGKQEGIPLEVYIGKVNEEEAKLLNQYCDRILVHNYIRKDYLGRKSIYSVNKERLRLLGKEKTVIAPIFSAEPVFSGSWVQKDATAVHGIYAHYVKKRGGFQSQSKALQQNIHLDGYVWFAYSHLIKALARSSFK
ncbi:MAG: hypothetical protein OIF50_17605 [Flavobacteriaceae bacterium]|nr:hypothetical protein [Flavobacteriaceae bacterium]